MARSWPVTFEPNLDSKYFSFLLNRIDSLAGTLKATPLTPGTRATIDRECMIRAIRGTNGIEGNRLSLDEVREVLEQPEKAVTPEQRDVLNAELALSQIRKRKPLPLAELAENTIKDVHDLVALGVDYLDQAPGEYRTTNIVVGSYLCPPASEVPTLMSLMTDYMNTRSVMTMHPIVRALVTHFYLASIHPFANDNGRATRAVESYLLYHGGYSHIGFYSLADYYYENQSDYIEELNRARFDNHGELRDWVIFGLEGFQAELEERQRLVFDSLRATTLTEYLDELVRDDVITSRLARVVGRVAAEDTGLSVKDIKNRHIPWLAEAYRGLSARSVRNDLTIMRRLGLIAECDGVIKVSYHALETPRS
jgi:Fic family protein